MHCIPSGATWCPGVTGPDPSLPWGTAQLAARDRDATAPGDMEESPAWEPEDWGSSRRWPAPRESRAGWGAQGSQVKPLGLAENGGGLEAWVWRAEGGGVSIPEFPGEKGTGDWDSWVLARRLETWERR